VKFELGSVFLSVIAFAMACACQPNEANACNATPSPQNSMTIKENRMKNESAIRELIDGFVKAIRAKDMNGVMSVFAPDVVSFDVGPPLQHGGGEAFMKRWQELFDSYQDQIDYEVRDLSITAGDDVEFSHSLNRRRATRNRTNSVRRHIDHLHMEMTWVMTKPCSGLTTS
jgi:ketosteroid isomerase-like protein